MPKLVFSLVYLGSPNLSSREHWYFFQIYSLPYVPTDRFEFAPFDSTNGWQIRSSVTSDCSISAIRRRITINPAALTTSSISWIECLDPRAILNEVLDALQEWALSFACTPSSAISDPTLSPEIRESMLELELNPAISPDETEDEGPAPVFLDEFVPPKIAF